MAMIEFDKVNIVFGDNPAAALPLMDKGMSREDIKDKTGQILGVHDCSLKVQEGEIAVLMGLSGSGKSTLLRAINGLNPVARGQMWVHDGTEMADIAKATPAALRRLRQNRVSMVFQQFGLLPWLTVLDNVAFGLDIAGVPAAEQRERAMVELARVNLTDWAPCKVRELSGGMQQRVGLARAFATNAPILLMDEPFSALDPLIRAKLQDELLELQDSVRRTIVFVSHDLEEAVKIGSHISIMDGGRIVQSGTPEDIVLHPATPYVAEFVTNLNPLPLMRARDAMNDAPATEGAPSVPPDMRAADLAALLQTHGGKRLAVVENGKHLGSIGAEDVLARLAAR
ncbi:choline ABC transporter ATP-binding protein [Abyssibius alkaniclasticus]|uniref:choline ABC transporter ATP-binding protein n=1 Tax=Abyssibius alkaniclasticus TaxID=2881234 RepID=UPI002363310C|nr:choline ABC transporter ATP-binding protein [Abyssibius alkaniclasticus]UPH69873.1 choline ABC transporter ATP-binding protein [Abyssibius alkaniclasticus]